ncbi:unnamed protein product [Urochloa humidicola]
MIRRFVNIVAENYKSGMYSLHRLDVSKHLFYPSAAEAQALSAAPEALANIGAGGDVPPMTERLPELPAPCMSFLSSPTNSSLNPNVAFFGLVSPRSSEGKVLCIDNAGHALLYDADSHSTNTLPSLQHPKGINPVSVSVTRTSAKEEDLYILHSARAGLESGSCFDVLRFGTPGRLKVVRASISLEGWYWQSLPLPPFVYSPEYKPSLISSYAVVEGGCTICLSSATEGIGTYCFDTVSHEWRHAGDWMMPFDGKAVYSPELKLWLGFSLGSHHQHLCATSGLSAMVNQPPVLQHVWHDHTPNKCIATWASILSLGAGRFCTAKVFKVATNPDAEEKTGYFSGWGRVGDEFVVLTGLEIHCRHGDDNNVQQLQPFEHKSILYNCTSNSIHSVL